MFCDTLYDTGTTWEAKQVIINLSYIKALSSTENLMANILLQIPT